MVSMVTRTYSFQISMTHAFAPNWFWSASPVPRAFTISTSGNWPWVSESSRWCAFIRLRRLSLKNIGRARNNRIARRRERQPLFTSLHKIINPAIANKHTFAMTSIHSELFSQHYEHTTPFPFYSTLTYTVVFPDRTPQWNHHQHRCRFLHRYFDGRIVSRASLVPLRSAEEELWQRRQQQ